MLLLLLLFCCAKNADLCHKDACMHVVAGMALKAQWHNKKAAATLLEAFSHKSQQFVFLVCIHKHYHCAPPAAAVIVLLCQACKFVPQACMRACCCCFCCLVGPECRFAPQASMHACYCCCCCYVMPRMLIFATHRTGSSLPDLSLMVVVGCCCVGRCHLFAFITPCPRKPCMKGVGGVLTGDKKKKSNT